MKTNWNCVSNRLGRMRLAYLHVTLAAIFALSGFPAQAAEPILCVLVPHFKDEYWLSVAHGIEERADDHGVSVRFFEAGGYRALAHQITQFDDCADLKPSAILIGAVSSDAPELLAAIRKSAEHWPVIGLVNDLHSDDLLARIGVDWTDMGYILGEDLTRRFPLSSTPQVAILLSGPAESGWVAPLEEGLRRGLTGSSIEIADVYSADTGTAEQFRLLEMALKDNAEPDLIIGAAPAIEAAMAYFSTADRRPLLAATYLSHSVARGLAGGQVIAAPFDDPIRQGAMAVDAAVRLMRDHTDKDRTQTDRTGPAIRLLTAGLPDGEVRLSPAEYFPKLD